MSFPDEKHQEMWQNVLWFDTISSEESGEEEGEEVIYVKHIPWRSKRFNDFVTRLDTQATSQKSRSAMARRQSKQREPGENPTRSPTADLPDWVRSD